MDKYKDELLNKLYENFLLYQEQIELLSDECVKPKFIQESLQIDKIESNCYIISHNFINSKRCHLLCFDDTAKIDINDVIENDMMMVSNIDLGDIYLSGKRNIYVYENQQITRIGNVKIKKLTSEDIWLFKKIKCEICEFETAEMLFDVIKNNIYDVYGIVNDSSVLSYVNMIKHNLLYKDKNVYGVNIFTAEKYRRQKYAQALLSNVINDYYKDYYVIYGVDCDNIPSNMVAQNVGLTHIGNNYCYIKTMGE